MLLGAGGLAVRAVVAFFRRWPALAGALWWTVVVAMLDWHLGMLEDHHGRPLPRLGWPNLLSTFRLGLVPALPLVLPALLAVF